MAMTLTAYARLRGVSTKAVSKAIAAGRLVDSVLRDNRGIPGISDPALADTEWLKNTRPRYGTRGFQSDCPPSERVYFIQCLTGRVQPSDHDGLAAGPIKIGTTVDVDARLNELQCASPFKLILVASIPGGYELEAELHRRLDAHRMRGEWFADTAEVRAVIREVSGL